MKFCLIFVMITSLTLSVKSQAKVAVKLPVVTLINQYPEAVITTRSKGGEDNKFGFEGGTAAKVGDTYHLFTSEMIGEPFWVKMRHGYWTSKDKIHWERIATIRESSGEFQGKNSRAALWSPMVYFDDSSDQWNMFYVAYHAEPNTDQQFRWNQKGRIYRSVSKTAGAGGIGGPYEDLGVILKPDENSGSWEGLQGTNSFYPWKVGNQYYAFYGSCSSNFPISHWLVGMATSENLKGPWKRMSERNPSHIEKKFIENPIVTPLRTGGYFCVYDNDKPDSMGWAYSKDGVNWSDGQSLVIQPQSGQWSKDIRTILGMIDEGDHKFTVFYTGFEREVNWAKLLKNNVEGITCGIGFVEIEIKLSNH